MREDSVWWRRRGPLVLLAAAVAVVVAAGVLVVDWLDRGDAPPGFAVAWRVDGVHPTVAHPRVVAPVVVGDLVVVTHPREITAFDMSTGAQRWKVPMAEDEYCGVAKGPDAIYLNLRDKAHECRTLVRIGPDGREAWRTQVDGELLRGRTSMTIEGRPDGVIVGTARSIVAYPATGGAPKWTRSLTANIWGDGEYGNDCRFADMVIGADVIATQVSCAEPGFAVSQKARVLELRAIDDGAVRHRGSVTEGQALVHASSGGAVTGTAGSLTFYDAQARQTMLHPHTGGLLVEAQGTPLLSGLPQEIQISGDLLVALGGNRRPVAIRISTGQVEWQAGDGEDFGCGGLVWEGSVLVCGEGHTMSSYDLATGDLETDQGIDVEGLADPDRDWIGAVRAGDHVVMQRSDWSLVGLVPA